MYFNILSFLLAHAAAIPNPSPTIQSPPFQVYTPLPTTSQNVDGIPCPGLTCYTYLVASLAPWMTGGGEVGAVKPLWDPAYVFTHSFVLSLYLCVVWDGWARRSGMGKVEGGWR